MGQWVIYRGLHKKLEVKNGKETDNRCGHIEYPRHNPRDCSAYPYHRCNGALALASGRIMERLGSWTGPNNGVHRTDNAWHCGSFYGLYPQSYFRASFSDSKRFGRVRAYHVGHVPHRNKLQYMGPLLDCRRRLDRPFRGLQSLYRGDTQSAWWALKLGAVFFFSLFSPQF